MVCNRLRTECRDMPQWDAENKHYTCALNTTTEHRTRSSYTQAPMPTVEIHWQSMKP